MSICKKKQRGTAVAALLAQHKCTMHLHLKIYIYILVSCVLMLFKMFATMFETQRYVFMCSPVATSGKGK